MPTAICMSPTAARPATVWKPDSDAPPCLRRPSAFATGVPGTNGLAFDRDGNLWTGDGTTGQGRVWKISPPAARASRLHPLR